MTPEQLPHWLRALTTRAAEVDGQPPFSDQTWVELRDGRRELLASGEDAAAAVRPGTPGELELVVHPDARGRGIGGALLERVLGEHPDILAWAHGDHPASRALAARTGFEPIRELLQLRRDIVDHEPAANALDGLTAFRPGSDDADWLALNAAAFASHPEQGSLTQVDLDERMSEPWFEAGDFLLLRDGDGLAAFVWMKVEDGIGEFYVVGVDPSRQGGGLGRRLVEAGLARLVSRGIRTASLYVDADNTAAVRLYRGYGFGDHTIDVQYRREVR
ncbi:MAG: mycothiol synthase [Salinibacterium sp.]|nr:mycothiol synthase [Salinibacterium sp.]MBF0671968.1 mycothiol synthase [Salinibacterium sp.]